MTKTNDRPLNGHQKEAMESLNKQIIELRIPNAEPYPLSEQISSSNKPTNRSENNEPSSIDKNNPAKSAYLHLVTSKSTIADGTIPDWDYISQNIINNIKKTTFLKLLLENGSDQNEYCGTDGSIKISEDLKCSLAVQHGLTVAAKIGFAIRGKALKEEYIQPYVFNGRYWITVSRPKLTKFFRSILPLLGFDKTKALILPRVSTHIIGAFNALAEELPQRNLSRKRLNLSNGILEVFKGKVQFTNSFSYEDGFTSCLPYPYQPDATHPLFTKYLDRVLPDKESQLLLQEAMGLSLVNENIQKIPYLLGDGSNGKSVLNDIMQGLLGSNMSRITLRNLMGDKSERNQANLEGIFINYPPENEDTKPNDFRFELFRTLADRNPLTVQKLYADLYEIQHYAYSVFNVNCLPKNPELSHAFFRRVMPILFDQTITDNEKDPELAKKIIATELPDVLNWLIEGAIRLQLNKHFSSCKKSDEVLDQYKQESDVVAMWLSDREYHESDIPMLLTRLFHDLDIYMDENGYKYQIKITTLANRLRGYKFRERKGKPLAFYIIAKN